MKTYKCAGGKLRGKSVIALLFITAVTVGCGMRKVEKQTSESALEQQLEFEQDSLQMQVRFTEKIQLKQQADSSANVYVLEIWPKGKFSINANGLFEGEAEKIMLQGQAVQTKKSSQLRQQDEASRSLNNLNTKIKSASKASQQQVLLKKNPAWMRALILLALAIGINLGIHFLKKWGLPGQRLL